MPVRDTSPVIGSASAKEYVRTLESALKALGVQKSDPRKKSPRSRKTSVVTFGNFGPIRAASLPPLLF